MTSYEAGVFLPDEQAGDHQEPRPAGSEELGAGLPVREGHGVHTKVKRGDSIGWHPCIDQAPQCGCQSRLACGFQHQARVVVR